MRPVMLGEPLGEERSVWYREVKRAGLQVKLRAEICLSLVYEFIEVLTELHASTTTLIPHYERLMTTSCELNPFSHQTSSPSNLIRSFPRW